MTTQQATTNDRREIFGWAMYDWANSAFSTTVGTVFLGPYIASLAAKAAETNPDGLARFFGIPVAPDSFLPYCISFSVGLQVLFLPILGAIADYSHLRKRMMQVFATTGAIATIAMFLVTGNLWWLGGVLFIIANLAFGAAIVFYNAYLPDIASEEERDRVSSYGFAMGYIGGGIWWMGFALLTWARLKPRHAARALPPGQSYIGVGFKQLGNTFRELKHFP